MVQKVPSLAFDSAVEHSCSSETQPHPTRRTIPDLASPSRPRREINNNYAQRWYKVYCEGAFLHLISQCRRHTGTTLIRLSPPAGPIPHPFSTNSRNSDNVPSTPAIAVAPSSPNLALVERYAVRQYRTPRSRHTLRYQFSSAICARNLF